MMLTKNKYCLFIISVLLIQMPHVVGQNLHKTGTEFLRSQSINKEIFPLDFKFEREISNGNQTILEADYPPCFVIFQEVNNTAKVIAYSTSNNLYRNDSIHPAIQNLLEVLTKTPANDLLKTGNLDERIPVGPLLKTKWNQDNWFNRYCPYEIKCQAGENVYVGCIAVAMGQIIKYYGKWNDFVIDASHTYNNEHLTASSIEYRWDKMIDNPVSYDLETCRLLSDIGILIQMKYGYQSSSQGTGRARIGFNNIGYKNAYKIDYHHFDNEEWLKLIYDALEEYNPIFVAGNGHAFVCDGYDQESRLHFNLGWAGYGDGYYDHNSIRGKYSVNEAIYETRPESDLEGPTNLRIELINDTSNIVWSPPDQYWNPLGYNVYYSEQDFFTLQDTIIKIENLKPGTHGIKVSALYTEGESLWIGPVWIYSPGESLTIQDPALKKALLDTQEKGMLLKSGLSINEGALADISSLSISDTLQSTYIINKLYRLQKLEINGAGLLNQDLQFISELPQIQSLKISNLNCDELPDIENLSKLVELKFESCRINNMEFLSGFKNLIVLEFNSCEIDHWESLNDVQTLEILSIKNTQLPDKDLFSQLSNLRTLEISGCAAKNLNLAKPLPKITCLNLNNNDFSNTGFLTNFRNIKTVSANNNEFDHLDIHSQHPYLNYMDFSNNRITGVSISFDLLQMNFLNLEGNGLEKFPGIFKNMPNLVTLNLSKNSIRCLPAMTLPYLKTLDISHNNLTHICEIDQFDALSSLYLQGNAFSDLSPLIKNNNYRNLMNLDLRFNPISEESFLEILPIIKEGAKGILAPPAYEGRSPCYPFPKSPARTSSRELLVSWTCNGKDPQTIYDLNIGIGDSLRSVYHNIQNTDKNIRLDDGQIYKWWIKAILPDTSFYSGLYEIRTTKDLELPYIEDFEHYNTGDNISSVSTNWRLTNGSSDINQDASISNSRSSGGSKKSLHINNLTDVSVDLDHLQEKTLIIEFDQFIIPGKSMRIRMNNISGLQLDLYSNGYKSEIYLNNSPLSEFDIENNQWNHFRISIQGINNRIVIGCNDQTILNNFWNFSSDYAQIENLVFSAGDLETIYTNFESYIDNFSIHDPSNITFIDNAENINKAIKVFPNPANQFLYLQGLPTDQKDLKVEIHNSRGQKILIRQVNPSSNDLMLRINHLAPGIYYYRLSSANEPILDGKLLIAR